MKIFTNASACSSSSIKLSFNLCAMDAEQLILEIRNRRCLWDQRDRSYKNRNLIEKLWQEVAEKMQTPSKYIIILLKIFFLIFICNFIDSNFY